VQGGTAGQGVAATVGPVASALLGDDGHAQIRIGRGKDTVQHQPQPCFRRHDGPLGLDRHHVGLAEQMLANDIFDGGRWRLTVGAGRRRIGRGLKRGKRRRRGQPLPGQTRGNPGHQNEQDHRCHPGEPPVHGRFEKPSPQALQELLAQFLDVLSIHAANPCPRGRMPVDAFTQDGRSGIQTCKFTLRNC